jgi:hypothetical protein
MELDELKRAWAQYDKKLSEHLKFNEDLFKKLNLDKSRKEMSAPLNYEIFSLVLAGIFFMAAISWTIQFSKERVYLIFGILSILSILTMLVFALVKIKRLSRMDYYNAPVIELQTALQRFKDNYFRLKRMEIILFPFYVGVLLPLFAKGLRNFDLIKDPTRYTTVACLAIGIGLPCALWIYKNLYERKIKNTTQFLTELSRFEKEEITDIQ